jgi:DNA processing protein
METCWEGGGLPPDELKRMLALSMAPGVGPATFHRLLEAFGSAESVFGAAAAELTAVCPQLRPETLEAILAGPNLRAVRFQEETCQRLRVRIVSARAEAFPDPVRQLPQVPPFLFVAGDWRPEDRRALAVVGTRYPSGYGTRMAREISMGLAEAGFTVVSGLARGIDTLAHQAALGSGARTMAVLGSGLDWIYPPENAAVARSIARPGARISEIPKGMAPHASHFPRRNRLISALSLGTLVVEAGNDSGALITADFALDQGREVFAVPGAVHQPGSQGTHKLIQQGAHLVERAGDILSLLQGTTQAVPARRFFSAAVAAPAPRLAAVPDDAQGLSAQGKPLLLELDAPEIDASEPTAPGANGEGDLGLPGAGAAVVTKGAAPTALEAAAAGLDDDARSLLSVLGREALTLDAIAEKVRRKPRFRDAKPHRLLTGLLELEMKGRVKRMPGALFRLA